jgi:hypothetical protein
VNQQQVCGDHIAYEGSRGRIVQAANGLYVATSRTGRVVCGSPDFEQAFRELELCDYALQQLHALAVTVREPESGPVPPVEQWRSPQRDDLVGHSVTG